MKTLKELNEKAWYRLVKVLYVFLYLPCLLVLFLAYEAGKEYHPPVYPNTIVEALNDPEFYKVDDWEKRIALEKIDKNFDMLGDKFQFIEVVKQIDIRQKEFKRLEEVTDKELLKLYNAEVNEQSIKPWERYQALTLKQLGVVKVDRENSKLGDNTSNSSGKYIYASYYTRSILKTVGYLLITGFCYVLFMEIIRRAFYYVAIGKLFPKE